MSVTYHLILIVSLIIEQTDICIILNISIENDLLQPFRGFGYVQEIKIQPERGFAFVK